jgi:hypothetical protein
MPDIDWSSVLGRYEDAVGVKPPRPLEQKQFGDLPSPTVDEVKAMLDAGTPAAFLHCRIFGRKTGFHPDLGQGGHFPENAPPGKTVANVRPPMRAFGPLTCLKIELENGTKGAVTG